MAKFELGENFSNLKLESRPQHIHKFGGSSLASEFSLKQVEKIIRQQLKPNDWIVVSANGPVTDLLVAYEQTFVNSVNLLGNQPESGLDTVKSFYEALVCSVFADLGQEKNKNCGGARLINEFHSDLSLINENAIRGDELLAYGEVWSAKLLVALLELRGEPAIFIDARTILISDSAEDFNSFKLQQFEENLASQLYGNFGKRVVITGFIASDSQQHTITLGRNGSDYSATLIARLSHAQAVTLWTDVAGVFTADPKLVDHAAPIPHLKFEEAEQLASLGTNVLHSKTLAPVVSTDIRVFVRSSLVPENRGTEISQRSLFEPVTNAFRFKSVAVKSGLCRLKIDLIGNIDWQDLKRQLFSMHVNLITVDPVREQGKAEFLVDKTQLSAIKRVLSESEIHFQLELNPLAIILIVGCNIQQQKHIRSQLSTLLATQLSSDSYSGSGSEDIGKSDSKSDSKSGSKSGNLDGCVLSGDSVSSSIIVADEQATSLFKRIYDLVFYPNSISNPNPNQRQESVKNRLRSDDPSSSLDLSPVANIKSRCTA